MGGTNDCVCVVIDGVGGGAGWGGARRRRGVADSRHSDESSQCCSLATTPIKFQCGALVQLSASEPPTFRAQPFDS